MSTLTPCMPRTTWTGPVTGTFSDYAETPISTGPLAGTSGSDEAGHMDAFVLFKTTGDHKPRHPR